MSQLQNLHRRILLLLVLVSVAVGGAASTASAQQATAAPMADRLPADVIFYAGWVGSDRMAELWDGTHTQALVQQSNFEDLFTRYLPEALDSFAQQEPEAAEAVALAKELLPLFIKRPSAFAFGGVNFAGGQPMPKLIFAIDAGDQAGELEQRLRALLQQAGQEPMGVFLTNQNGIVRFALGYDLAELDRLAAGQGENSLAASEAFTATMGGLTDAPTSAFYLDFARLLAQAEEAAGMFAPPEAQPQIKQMIDATGIRGLGRLGATSGFAGKMFETRGFLSLTGREGFLRLIPDGPLDQQTLAAIPASATMVTANQLDLAVFFDVMRQIIIQIQPQAEEEIDQVLAQVNQAAGADVEADVLAQFGTTWGFYVSPQIGSGIFSGVALNRPRDPAKLEQSLTSVSRNLLAMANQHIQQETDGNIALPGRTAEINGQTLHILNLPGFAPTWSIDGETGVMRMGLYPQSILSARALEGESFVESQRWQALVGQLEPGGEIASIRFNDLPALAPDSYPLLMLGSQGLLGAVDLFSQRLGTQPPVVVLPPLATMMQHIEPSGAVTWVTDDGVHFRSLEPFPGSSVLTMDWQSFAAQQYSTLVSVLLPSLNRAREAANRIKSGSNLRQIGQGMRMVAIDDVRQGRYPADLQTLFMQVESLPIEVFISPRSGTQPPEMMAQSREVQAQWVAENSDYVYLGGGLTDSAPSTVMVAYEDPEKIGWNDGINVLYADGSVVFVLLPMFDQEIQRHIQHREQKGLPVPEVLRQ